MSTWDELQVSEFLADHLTSVNGTKFTARSEDEEAHDVDTYIESLGYVVKVQNVSSEGDLLHNANRNKRAMNKGLDFEVSDVDHKTWITDVIKKKERKGYRDPITIMLVIRGSMPTEDPYKILELTPIAASSSFGGVYYVCMPSSDPKSGYVVALKKYWKTPDIF